MRKCWKEEFAAFLPQARAAAGDSVYPCAIAEGIQSGDIYTDGHAVLFHHYCGFAYFSGDPDAAFLSETAECFFGDHPQPRRFALITDRADVIDYYANLPQIIAEKRLYFTADAAPDIAVPEGFSCRPVTSALLPRIQGRIIPAFSWESDAQFLRSGFGSCILQGETVAACAFSAAVTAEAVDIGLETQEAFRRRGLAVCAAAAVMREIIRQGKTPVWACHAANTGSAKTALRLGFRPTHTCTVLRRCE